MNMYMHTCIHIHICPCIYTVFMHIYLCICAYMYKMYIYLCICAYMYKMYIYLCICACMYKIYIYLYIYMCVCMRAYMNNGVLVHMRVCMTACLYLRMCIFVNITCIQIIVDMRICTYVCNYAYSYEYDICTNTLHIRARVHAYFINTYIYIYTTFT